MKQQISKIRFLEDSLIANDEILIIGDTHIGYEEYLYGRYVFPRVQLKEMIEKLDRIFRLLEKDNIKIKKVVILGDLKHEFGEISDSEWRETLQFLDYLIAKVSVNNKEGNKIILIKGNHDNILGPIANKREIKIKDYYKTKEICFIHGDKLSKGCEDSKILIVGHLHPSISLDDEYKTEKYKCFLKGKWKRKQVYFVPSFIPLSFGYDLKNLKEDKKGFSIVDNKKLKGFEIVVYNNKEDKKYNFGKLGNLI